MTNQPISELESFHRFVQRLLNSQTNMSPEDALALWREERDNLQAIQQGLDDVAAGRTMSIADFDRDFRKRHGLQ